MTEYRDTEYPHGTFRSWEFDLGDQHPIFHLPDPKESTASAVEYYEPWSYGPDVKPDAAIPKIRLYRVCHILFGPGYTDTGEAFIHGEDPAHLHRIYGWADDPATNGKRQRVDGKYLKPEFRRP